MFYILKKISFCFLLVTASLLSSIVSGGATNINTSLPIEQQPLYVAVSKAMASKDYAKAREMLLNLGKVEPYKARSFRELGILEMSFEMNQAVIFFQQAFNLGDKESFALYLDALAQTGRFDELKPYYNEIFWGALGNRYLLETLCLTTEHRNQETDIKPFLIIVRRAPIEITIGNLSLVRLLIKYNDPQDKLLVNFLIKGIYDLGRPQLRDSVPVKEIYFPDDADVRNYKNTDDYKFFAKYLVAQYTNGRSTKYGRQEAIDKLSNLARNPRYQTLANANLATVALMGADYLRVEQLCELALRIGDKRNERLIYPLFTSLMMQNKLDEAKKQESVFFNYTFSKNADIGPDTFARYCLLTNNKEMFLKWVRSSDWKLLLNDPGTKELILEGLHKWGEEADAPLTNLINISQTILKNELDWSLDWGIPDVNGEIVGIPKWQPPASLP